MWKFSPRPRPTRGTGVAKGTGNSADSAETVGGGKKNMRKSMFSPPKKEWKYQNF